MKKSAPVSTPVDPVTPGEWQDAVDVADFWLHVDSAVQYGLMKVVPVDKNGKQTAGRPYKRSGVNQQRCIDIIKRGAEKGITPRQLWKK